MNWKTGVLLLVALALSAMVFHSQTKTSRIQAGLLTCQVDGDVRALALSVTLYRQEHGKFPNGISDLREALTGRIRSQRGLIGDDTASSVQWRKVDEQKAQGDNPPKGYELLRVSRGDIGMIYLVRVGEDGVVELESHRMGMSE